MRMPHIRIAAAVLCAVLLTVTCTACFVHRTLTSLLTLTEAAYAQGAPAEAVSVLTDEWEQAAPKLRLLLPNGLLSDLNEAIERIAPGTDAGRTELRGIAADLRWLDRKQILFPI